MSGAAVALRYPAFGASLPPAAAKQQCDAFAQMMDCARTSGAATLVCPRAFPAAIVLAAQRPYLTS
ncbi:hypothetical protein [Pseudomonas sp. NY15354]|uniref:hypothetical protein n=1 Tax=Pseudomonas sp. NY15354 TaxID=3400351 RepID=UPI003A865119